jgi:hypothetical protein
MVKLFRKMASGGLRVPMLGCTAPPNLGDRSCAAAWDGTVSGQRPLLLLLCAVTTACVALPDPYPVPPQRTPALAAGAPTFTHALLRMNEVETDAYIVRDIPKGETGPWRWAGQRPSVRLYLTDVNGYRVRLEYTIAEVTFKATGPVTFRVLINDRLLETVPHKQHGTFVYDKSVPAGMLKANGENDLTIEVDKPWVSPNDGAKLGFILAAVGFVR